MLSDSLKMQPHRSSLSAQETGRTALPARQRVLGTRGDDPGAGHERSFHSPLFSDISS